MKKPIATILPVLLFIIISSQKGHARRITISEYQYTIKKNHVPQGISPGDTLLLKAGKRDWLLFENIHGAPGKPVVIINEGGIAEISGQAIRNHAIRFSDCRHIKLTGNGVPGSKYGIKISFSATGTHGISLENFSDHFEMEYVEICNTGFAGLMAKTDRAGKGWTMKNLLLHDNYIHDTREGEGFYIGNNSWTAQNDQHNIDSLSIYRNFFENTAAEGIQVGCTYSGNADIYDNIVVNYGKSMATFATHQGNGIQLGNGFSGRVFNNLIKAGPDTLSQNGLNILGRGDIVVYRNIIISPRQLGIYSGHQTAEPDRSFYYFNNIFVNTGKEAIQYDPRIKLKSYFHNNVIVNEGNKKIADVRSGVLDTLNNEIYTEYTDLDKIAEVNFLTDPPIQNKVILNQLKQMKEVCMNEKLYVFYFLLRADLNAEKRE